MAGFFTDYANNAILDTMFGSVVYTPPTTLYVGLSLGTANKTGAVSEPSGAGYSRVPVVNNLTTFPHALAGSKANSTAITFPSPTADWGTVQSLFVSDAMTGGNVVAMADLTSPKTILNGSNAPTVVAGALYISHT